MELTQELIDCRWQELVRPLRRARTVRKTLHGAAMGAACAAAVVGGAAGLGIVVHETMNSISRM